MDEPFGPAWRYAFLIPCGMANNFRPADVLTLPSGTHSPAGAGRYLPLFRSHPAASRWIKEGTVAGRVEPIAAPTADALTNLLASLRHRGVTHVAVDPEPGTGPTLFSIERAIISFGLCG